MVERLKIAVEKARARRALAEKMRDAGAALAATQTEHVPEHLPADPEPAEPPLILGSAAAPLAPEVTPEVEVTPQIGIRAPQLSHSAAAWNALQPIELSPRHLERNRLIAHAKTDPAHVAIDVLRTRLLGALTRNGWSRVGITSPNAACGKTFIAANLALSLSRQSQYRTVLIDMDLRRPSLARALGVPKQDSLRWFLEGEIPATEFLLRSGGNLAFGLNSKRLRDAGEVIQSRATAHALGALQAQFEPDAVLYDLPPMLAGDDVMGFLPNLDGMLLVIGGGVTRPAEVAECERLLADNDCPLLGVILNKGEGVNIKRYAYD